MPRDVNQMAKLTVEMSAQALEESPRAKTEKLTKSEISRVMAEMGRKGGKIGGKRKLETLSRERRQEIALNAARARWANNGKH
jgi:hypothetical protein